MNKKFFAITFIISVLLFLATAIFLVTYYNCIEKNHEGPMDVWATCLLVFVTLIFLVLLFITRENNVTISDCFKNKETGEKVSNVIFIILTSPLLLVTIIISFFAYLFHPEKSTFKPLIKKGFTYKKQKNKYLLIKNSIHVIFPFDNGIPLISFDGGENFENVLNVEKKLGSIQERENLKELQIKYEGAHPVDKQRGDAVPPTKQFVSYLEKYL